MQYTTFQGLMQPPVAKTLLLFAFLLLFGCQKAPKQQAPTLPPMDLYYGLIPDHQLLADDVACMDGLTGQLLARLNFFEEQALSRHTAISTKEEIRLAADNHHYVAEKYDIITDDRAENLQHILDQLVEVLYQELPHVNHPNYQVFLIKTKEGVYNNAFTTGGGFVYFSTDLYAFCKSDAERAFILGHEIGHVLMGHCVSYEKRQSIATTWLGDKWGEMVGDVWDSAMSPIEKSDETICDLISVYATYFAGYNPEAGLYVYRRFNQELPPDNNGALRYLSSHPHNTSRVSCVGHYLFEAKARAARKR